MLSTFFRWRNAERGMGTLALTLMAMPLLLAVFGYSFDYMRVAHVKRFVQGRVDLAAAAGATFTYVAPGPTPPKGAVLLGKDGDGYTGRTALIAAIDSYAKSTDYVRGEALSCGTPLGANNGVTDALGNPPAGATCFYEAKVVGIKNTAVTDFCQFQQSNQRYGLRVTVVETVPYMFLKLIGVEDQTLKPLRAEALLRQNC